MGFRELGELAGPQNSGTRRSSRPDLLFHPALESSFDWFRLEKEIASALRVGRWGQILIVILPLHCPGTAVNCIYSCTATYSLLALATV